MTRILDFGKNKGKILADCEESYLKWLVSHEKVLALRNRWAARDAKYILERREQAVKLAAYAAEREARLAVIAAEQIVRASAKTDLGLTGHLNTSRAFRLL